MSQELNTKNVVFIGLGLMAGSLALAFKQYKCFDEIIGYDINPEVIEYAENKSIIDKKITSLTKDSINTANLIVLGTPITETMDLLTHLHKVIDHKSVVLDLCSTKRSIMKTAKECFVNHPAAFIGGHPMVGKDQGGIKNAVEALYNNKPFVLVPTNLSSSTSTKLQSNIPVERFKHSEELEQLKQILTTIGAKPVIMTEDQHDHMAAALSHLPHLLAGALISTVTNQSDHKFSLSLAGGSFKDITRVAKADPNLWKDIFYHNNDEIEAWWEKLKQEVDHYFNQRRTDAHQGTKEQDPSLETGTFIDNLEEIASVRKAID